jgi:hypothetical protein
MAAKNKTKEPKDLIDEPEEEEIVDDGVDIEDEAELEEVDDLDVDAEVEIEAEVEAEVGAEVEAEVAIEEIVEEEVEADEALDELEEDELELLEDEVSEILLVDEAAELRAIRREELTMDVDAHAVRDDEFVCRSCFLVKRTSQLANRRKMICRDCAS